MRHHGFGSRVSRTDVTTAQAGNINANVQPTSAAAQALLSAEAERATTLVRTHGDALRALAQQPLANDTVAAAGFATVTRVAVNLPAAGAAALACAVGEVPAVVGNSRVR